MQIDIYIREKTGTREIRVPVLPESISFKSGAATFAIFEILKKGEVAVPTGSELSALSWSSEFPGELRKNDPMIRGSWIAPKTYHSILESWKNSGTELNILVTGYPINADVYLREYTATAAGAFGDIVYEVAFVESRDITIKTTKVKTSEPATTTKRPAKTGKSYTIKQGDNLWTIAYKFYGKGAKWKIIYDANKDIIETTAKARWKAAGINRDSQNGHWIFPGVTLTIPNA